MHLCRGQPSRLDDRELSRRCLLVATQHVGPIGDDALIAHTKRHLERWPDDDEIAILRTENLATLSRFDDALKALVTTSAHSSQSMTKATLRLAAAQISLNQLEDPAEAINHVRDALAFEPKLASEALALLKTIGAEWQINLDLAIPFIETLDELGQFERSQQIWATASQMHPTRSERNSCFSEPDTPKRSSQILIEPSSSTTKVRSLPVAIRMHSSPA